MKAYSLDLRTKILAAYHLQEGSIRQLAQRFKVSARFVGALVARFRRTGSGAPKPHGGGNPPCIAPSHYEHLALLVQQAPDATLKELCRALAEQYQVTASKSSLQRTLAKLQLTRKKKTRYATERTTEDVQEQRRLYQAKVSALDVHDLIFVDETGVNIAMVRPYARSPKGERAYAPAPVNTGKNITVLGALSLEGLVEAMTIEGSSDGQVFATFIQQICGPTLQPGKTVIMDNLSSHKVDGIQQAIEARGAHVEYLPSYSPDLSPIEECWSKFKTILRAKAARTYAHLDQAITEAFAMITPQDAQGWFAHCGYL